LGWSGIPLGIAPALLAVTLCQMRQAGRAGAGAWMSRQGQAGEGLDQETGPGFVLVLQLFPLGAHHLGMHLPGQKFGAPVEQDADLLKKAKVLG